MQEDVTGRKAATLLRIMPATLLRIMPGREHRGPIPGAFVVGRVFWGEGRSSKATCNVKGRER